MTSSDTPTFQNYIGGTWQPAYSGQTFPNYNPATGELLGHFPLSDHIDVTSAVVAARTAFEQWRLVPAPKRGEILFRVGELMTRHKEELARTMTLEMGKVLKETRGDVQEGIDMAYYMGGEGRRLAGYTVPVEMPNKTGMALRDPSWCCRVYHTVEFSYSYSNMEDVPSTDCRQHGGAQACGRHTAQCVTSGRTAL